MRGLLRIVPACGVCLLLIAARLPAQPTPGAGDLSQRQAQLIERWQKLQDDSSPEDTRASLDKLAADGSETAALMNNPAAQSQCLQIELRAYYLNISRYPQDAETGRRIAAMRDAARRLKAVNQADALSMGDFWLTQAELLDLNRSSLSPEERTRQAMQMLRSFLVVHNRGPAVDAARGLLRRLNDEALAEGTTPITDPTAVAPAPRSAPPTPPYELGQQSLGSDGLIRLELRCRYQAGPTVLRILEPTKKPKQGEPVTFLFVLPVEPAEGTAFGDPVEVIRKLDLHNKHNLVVVYPTFSDMPWYADHPTDATLRQESYVVRVVVPAAQSLYKSEANRSLLLGFSKSGWGAVSLLCRNPSLFDAAAAWDAPLMVKDASQFGMNKLMPTTEAFNRYALGEQFKTLNPSIRKNKRIVLLGYDYFGDHIRQAHELLESQNIPHEYDNATQHKHRWDSGWVEGAVDKLVATGAGM